MDFVSALKDKALAMTGNIEKAVIVVMDTTEKINVNPAAKPVAAAGIGSFNVETLIDNKIAEIGVPESVNQLRDAAMEVTKKEGATEEEKKKAWADYEKAMGEYRETLGAVIEENAKTWTFEVPFNPSELRIMGYSGGRMAQTIYENNPHEKTDLRSSAIMPTHTHIELSVRLTFDRTDPQDAFMADKFSLNLTSAAKGVAKAILTGTGKKKVSVQPEVEAFMACVRNPDRRVIQFNWGDMCYQGVLNRVSAEYVMFNVNGDPCRAYVDLSIVCADSQRFRNSISYWENQMTSEYGAGDYASHQSADAEANLLNPQMNVPFM